MPGGVVEANQTFRTAALETTKRSTGVEIELAAILRQCREVLSPKNLGTRRVVVFHARPTEAWLKAENGSYDVNAGLVHGVDASLSKCTWLSREELMDILE